MKKRFIALTSLISILLISALYAHEGEEESSEGYRIEVMPLQPTKDSPVLLETRIAKYGAPLANMKVTLTIDKHDVGLSEQLPARESALGHYVAEYTFKYLGPQEVHIEFQHEGTQIRQTFPVDVRKSQGNRMFIIGGIAAIIILAIVWYIDMRSKQKKKAKLKTGIVLTVDILVILGIGYSLYVTLKSGAASRGVVVCPQEGRCFWQAHIHAYIPIMMCGEDIRLPIEKGSLQGPHTHEEKNVVHWHDRLPYDNQQKNIFQAKPLTLGVFFDELGIPFANDALFDRKNGDECPDGTLASWKMFVNGKQSQVLRDHVWTDRQVIALVFDSRSSSDIEAELQANPIKFPSLGRG